jgi:sugar phosphate isomerase/epimerase
MKNFSRRSFIKHSGAMMAVGAVDINGMFAAKMPKTSFSTLGCPDWSLDQIVSFAVKNNFSALEIRGIQRQIDLSKSPHFNSESAIKETRKKVNGAGLKFAVLGSSAALHHPEGAEKEKSMDEAKRFIGIAHGLGCPYVRVFPNELPKDGPEREKTMDIISKTFSQVADNAKGTGVKILMETHGELVHAVDIERVMNNVENQEGTGLVWDISNMWSVTKEEPAEVYGRLKKWIRHTHLKDLKIVGDEDVYTMFGEGEVPIFEAIDLLVKNNFQGYYSFEWEKLWHPDIAEPEIAIAQFAKKMKEHFRAK